MNYEKTINYIENSFLNPLLGDSNITDITYNGNSIFYLDNYLGRRKSDILVDKNQIRDFIRQLSFLTEKQFSYQHPFLDVSVGRYRINAVHSSIGRIGNEETITFSIRIASVDSKIQRDNGFMPQELVTLFDVLLKNKISMSIGGLTGSGKTEFQKYLLRNVGKNTRVIVIDNVLELEQIRQDNPGDINTWQVDERNSVADIQSLVRNALRSNPDWLIVAESRGKEMLELLNSMMTGHPIITTIHAMDLDSMPFRMIRMVMMSDKKMDYRDVKLDLLYHMHFYIYLKHDIDENGVSKRYISGINYLDSKRVNVPIYRFENGTHLYQKLPQKVTKKLKFSQNDKLFIDTFVEKEEENNEQKPLS